MPIYYFHVRDGDSVVRDTRGTEVPNLELARHEARAVARDLAINEIRADRHIDGRTVEIADERGEVLDSVMVRDVLL